MNDILAETDQPTAEDRVETNDAAVWLTHYLASKGGEALRTDVLKAAHAERIAERTLTRARTKAGVTTTREGYAGGTVWRLNPRHGT